MSEEKTEQVNIFNLHEVPVTVTYSKLGAEPITFYLRPCLVGDDQDERQAFLSLKDEEQAKARAPHYAEMLHRLSVRPPTGLPDDFTGDIRTYFNDGNPMKEKVAADVYNRYNLMTQPEELFRSV